MKKHLKQQLKETENKAVEKHFNQLNDTEKKTEEKLINRWKEYENKAMEKHFDHLKESEKNGTETHFDLLKEIKKKAVDIHIDHPNETETNTSQKRHPIHQPKESECKSGNERQPNHQLELKLGGRVTPESLHVVNEIFASVLSAAMEKVFIKKIKNHQVENVVADDIQVVFESTSNDSRAKAAFSSYQTKISEVIDLTRPPKPVCLHYLAGNCTASYCDLRHLSPMSNSSILPCFSFGTNSSKSENQNSKLCRNPGCPISTSSDEIQIETSADDSSEDDDSEGKIETEKRVSTKSLHSPESQIEFPENRAMSSYRQNKERSVNKIMFSNGNLQKNKTFKVGPKENYFPVTPISWFGTKRKKNSQTREFQSLQNSALEKGELEKKALSNNPNTAVDILVEEEIVFID